MSKADEKIKEQRKYIHKVLNNMKIDNEDEFMNAVANVIFEDNRKLKQLETKQQKAVDYCKKQSKFQTFGDEKLSRILEAYTNRIKQEILEIMKGEE